MVVVRNFLFVAVGDESVTLSSNGFSERCSFHKSNLTLKCDNTKAGSSEHFANPLALYETFAFYLRCPPELNNEEEIFLYETAAILFMKCQFIEQLSHTSLTCILMLSSSLF